MSLIKLDKNTYINPDQITRVEDTGKAIIIHQSDGKTIAVYDLPLSVLVDNINRGGSNAIR